MKYKVDGWNNFCRVFELPEKYSSKFCFGGGIPTNFQMVDWFNPVMELPNPAVSKEFWHKNVGEIEEKVIDIDELYNSLVPFLLEKIYTQIGKEYIVLFDFGAVIRFKKGSKDEL